jgi:hypothetical protein
MRTGPQQVTMQWWTDLWCVLLLAASQPASHAGRQAGS